MTHDGKGGWDAGDNPGRVLRTRVLEAIVIAALTSGVSVIATARVLEAELAHLRLAVNELRSLIPATAAVSARIEELAKRADRHSTRLERLERLPALPRQQ